MEKIEKRKLESNIWKYGLYLITQRRIIWPLLTVYFLMFPDNTARQIGIFMAIGQIAGFVFEIPSGYISDKIGHKKALLLSKTALIIASTFFLLGGGIVMFTLGSAFFAIGLAFTSGTLDAFMHEVLTGLNKSDRFSEITGKVRSRTLLISAAMLAALPFLVNIDMRLPFAVALAFDIAGLFITLSFVPPKHTHVEIAEIKNTNFRQVLRDAKRLHFIAVIIIVSVLTSVRVSSAVYRDVYQQALGISIVHLGILFAVSRLFASFVIRMIYRLKNVIPFQTYLLLMSLFTVTMIAAAGYVQNRWIVALIFIVNVGMWMGSLSLNTHYELEYIQKSKFKATLLSLVGMVQHLVTFGTSLVFAVLVGWVSYRLGYVYFAIISLVLLTIAFVLFLKYSAGRAEGGGQAVKERTK